jgi:maleate isomerase
MWAADSSVEVLERMNEDVEACARHLGSAAVDVIAYACTGGSLLGGVGFDKSLARRISEIAGGIPTVATATAVADGLRTLGVKKVSLVTPYLVSADGRRHKRNLDIGADTPEIIADFVDKHLAPEADGIFLSCTNWRAVEVAERLETETGLPVVTSNQATIWATLDTLGLDEPRPGYGRLFRSVGSTMAA